MVLAESSAEFTHYEEKARCEWTHASIKAKLISVLHKRCFTYMSNPPADDYDNYPSKPDGTCFELRGGDARTKRPPQQCRGDPHKNYDSFSVYWKDFLECPGGEDEAWDIVVARILKYSARWEEGWRKVREIHNYGEYLFFIVSGYSYEYAECFPDKDPLAIIVPNFSRRVLFR